MKKWMWVLDILAALLLTLVFYYLKELIGIEIFICAVAADIIVAVGQIQRKLNDNEKI